MWESQLWILFSSSFLSATLLPGASEVNMIYLAQKSQFSPVTLLAVATCGNTLGGLTNYGVGRLASQGIRLKYFERENLQGALEGIRRYGGLSLLLSWLPVVGDPLCLAAGYLKVNWLFGAICMAVGKLARYLMILFAVA